MVSTVVQSTIVVIYFDDIIRPIPVAMIDWASKWSPHLEIRVITHVDLFDFDSRYLWWVLDVLDIGQLNLTGDLIRLFLVVLLSFGLVVVRKSGSVFTYRSIIQVLFILIALIGAPHFSLFAISEVVKIQSLLWRQRRLLFVSLMVHHVLRPVVFRLCFKRIAVCMLDMIMIKSISNSKCLFVDLKDVPELFMEKSTIFNPREEMEKRNDKHR